MRNANSKGSRLIICYFLNRLPRSCWMASGIQDRRKDFQKVQIQHTSRICNTNTHSLAKRAVGCKEPVVWMNNVPSKVMCLFSL